jgi:hypothetical protein
MSTFSSKTLLLLLSLFLLFTKINGWWCESHMLIAQVAKDNLDPEVLKKVNENIKWFSETNDFPLANDIVDVACWADDLKSKNKLYAMEEWHFINLPYNPYNMTIPYFEKLNVVYETNEMGRALEELHKHKSVNEWVKSFSLANMIHFYGDVHQPLHATEYYNPKYFPNGDEGGLLFDIYIENYPMKLHFAWDSVCRKYIDAPTRPLNDSSRDMIENVASYLQQTYNFTDEQKQEYNMTKMALESYNYAILYAYVNNTIQINQTLDSNYIANCIEISEMRLTLAGYRLASQLNYLFK